MDRRKADLEDRRPTGLHLRHSQPGWPLRGDEPGEAGYRYRAADTHGLRWGCRGRTGHGHTLPGAT